MLCFCWVVVGRREHAELVDCRGRTKRRLQLARDGQDGQERAVSTLQQLRFYSILQRERVLFAMVRIFILSLSINIKT